LPYDHFLVNRIDIAKLDVEATDQIIAMAWADRVPFERIEEKTGLREADVITVMRRSLKPKSFRVWRARVSGRSTKHRKLFRGKRKFINKQNHEALLDAT
jgi:uncharacterized protein (TIGR03643 family)